MLLYRNRLQRNQLFDRTTNPFRPPVDWRGRAWHRLDRVLRLALPVALCVGTVLGVAWVVRILRTPPVYEAWALLRVRADWKAPLDVDAHHTNLAEHISLTLQRIRGPACLVRVLADPDIARLTGRSGEPIDYKYLEQNVQVQSIEQSELFRISLRHEDPKQAAEIVNAVLDAYVKVEGDRDAHASQLVVDIWDRELDRMSRELEAVRKLARELSTQDQPTVADDVERALAWLGERRAQLAQRRSEWEARRTFAQQPDNTLELIKELKPGYAERLQEELANAWAAQTPAKPLDSNEADQRAAERKEWIRINFDRSLDRHDAHLRPLFVGLCTEEIDRLTAMIDLYDVKIDQIEREPAYCDRLAVVQLEVLRTELENLEAAFKVLAERAESQKVEMR